MPPLVHLGLLVVQSRLADKDELQVLLGCVLDGVGEGEGHAPSEGVHQGGFLREGGKTPLIRNPRATTPDVRAGAGIVAARGATRRGDRVPQILVTGMGVV